MHPDHKLTSKSQNGTEVFNRNKIRVGRKGYRIKRSFMSIKSKHIFNRLIIIIVRHFLPSKIAWAKNRLILDNLHQPRPSVDVIFFYVSVGKSVTIESKCHSKISSNTFLVKNICPVRFKLRILKWKLHLNETFDDV